MKTFLIILTLAIIIFFLSKLWVPVQPNINSIAEHYVKLVLALGKYDPDYVDAYFGPEKWKIEAGNWKLSIRSIEHQTDSLIKLIALIDTTELKKMEMQRFHFLKRMIESVKTKAELLSGKKMKFDDESQALYDDQSYLLYEGLKDEALRHLDKLLPGEGALAQRFAEFRKQFIIPQDKVDTIVKTALAEGKRRTLKYIRMTENENLTIEYVRNKPWGGYNWFKGNAQSLIQINLDLPKYIDGIVNLMCHECYPGHHVYHSLIEENYVKKNGWMEFTVYPLFSPLAVMSEGTAEYGIEVAFPVEERNKFIKDILFPLAGISTENAERYFSIMYILENHDENTITDIAREYLDGYINRDEAINKIMKYKLRTREQAEINLKFIEKYRSYIITYHVGKGLCRTWISYYNDDTIEKKRWEKFKQLLTIPYMPGDLLDIMMPNRNELP